MAILYHKIICSEPKKITCVLLLKTRFNVHISLWLSEAASMLEIINCVESSPSALLHCGYIEEGDASKD